MFPEDFYGTCEASQESCRPTRSRHEKAMTDTITSHDAGIAEFSWDTD